MRCRPRTPQLAPARGYEWLDYYIRISLDRLEARNRILDALPTDIGILVSALADAAEPLEWASTLLAARIGRLRTAMLAALTDRSLPAARAELGRMARAGWVEPRVSLEGDGMRRPWWRAGQAPGDQLWAPPVVTLGDAYHPVMVDVKVTGIVRATPDEVFAFLADLENWPRWQSDMKSAALAEGEKGQVGAVYRYLSKAMGMTFDSTVRLTRVDPPREVAFEGEWTGMIRPNGRYLVAPAPEGSRVTLNPRPEVRGIGRIMEPLIAFMGRRLNREHLKALRQVLEKG
jgi:uncharacterized protein YndB with AHSA1/START domain